ncbi:MAG TPA: hypothetical protein ENJ00_11320 [Phycisphaerales bacterium]|nr:hypothetical protein [Phycisphaerales bacterium]
MSVQTELGILFAGGGTGGHIHPNLAIAESLEQVSTNTTRFAFLISDRAIDAEVLSNESIAGEPVQSFVSPAKPLAFRPRGLIRFVGSWGGSVRAARSAIRELSATCQRVVVVATGGFVSPAAIQAARAQRISSVLVNLDAVPGKANRWIARHADRVLSSAPVDSPKFERIAPVVRARYALLPAAAPARHMLGLEPNRPTLLITGGSQGASSINTFLVKALTLLHDECGLDRWQVIHQTGPGGADQVGSAYRSIGIHAVVRPYFERMDLALASADAAVTRGGAGAVAELWASHTPAIVLPYPYHRDEHQRLNARELEEIGGVIIATDRVDPDLNVQTNLDALRALFDKHARGRMQRAMDGLGPADGAERVAEILLNEAVGCH